MPDALNTRGARVPGGRRERGRQVGRVKGVFPGDVSGDTFVRKSEVSRNPVLRGAIWAPKGVIFIYKRLPWISIVMTSETTDDPARMTLRLPTGLKERLNALARRNKRSLTKEIELAIEEHLDASQ